MPAAWPRFPKPSLYHRLAKSSNLLSTRTVSPTYISVQRCFGESTSRRILGDLFEHQCKQHHTTGTFSSFTRKPQSHYSHIAAALEPQGFRSIFNKPLKNTRPSDINQQAFCMAAHQYGGQKRPLEESAPDPGEEGSSQPAKRQYCNNASNDGQASSHSAPTGGRIFLPKPSDLPQTLKIKLTAIIRTLRSGQSIGSATHFAATPNHTRDPVAKAKQEMHPTELWMWNTYIIEPKVKLPVIDWTFIGRRT